MLQGALAALAKIAALISNSTKLAEYSLQHDWTTRLMACKSRLLTISGPCSTKGKAHGTPYARHSERD
jgi:3-deoxy-D-arabino-heptulosonate 7-phosphate (DAHP) synthase